MDGTSRASYFIRRNEKDSPSPSPSETDPPSNNQAALLMQRKERKSRPSPSIQVYKEEVDLDLEGHFRSPIDESKCYLDLQKVDQTFPQNTKVFEDERYGVLCLCPSQESFTLKVLPNKLPLPFDAPNAIYKWDIENILSIKICPPPEDTLSSLGRAPVIAILNNSRDYLGILNCRTGEVEEQIFSAKNQKIRFFCWASSQNLVVVTTTSVEVFQYISKHNRFQFYKDFKHRKIHVGFFDYSTQILLLLTGNRQNALQPYNLSQGHVIKLTKFWFPDEHPPLYSHQIRMFNCYRRTFIAIFHPQYQNVAVYQLAVDKKDPFLPPLSFLQEFHTNNSQKVAVSVLDELFLIHDRERKVSLAFDIREPSPYPIATPFPFAHIEREQSYENNFLFFSSVFAFDLQQACAYRLGIKMESLVKQVPRRREVIPFLLRRKGTPALLLKELKQDVEERSSLSYFAAVFDQINRPLSLYYESTDHRLFSFSSPSPSSSHVPISPSPSPSPSSPSTSSLSRSHSPSPLSEISSSPSLGPSSSLSPSPSRSSSPSSTSVRRVRQNSSLSVWKEEDSFCLPEHREIRTPEGLLVVDQSEMYHNVLRQDEITEPQDLKFLVSVIVEYIRSLNFHHIPPKSFLNDLVVQYLITSKRFYQLHQFLQYHVFTLSYSLATQLISIKDEYPPAFQLAIDMFKQFPTTQTIEILLAHKEVLTALRMTRGQPLPDELVRRFFEVAQEHGDPVVNFTVCQYFKRYLVLNKKNQDLKVDLEASEKKCLEKFDEELRESEEEQMEAGDYPDSPQWLK